MAKRRGMDLLNHPLIAPFAVLTALLFFIWIVAQIFANVNLPENSTLATAFNTITSAFSTVAGLVIVALIAGVGIYVLLMLIRVFRGE
jgi:hypothetical protein